MDDNTEHPINAASPTYSHNGKPIDTNESQSSNAKLLTYEHKGKSIFLK